MTFEIDRSQPDELLEQIAGQGLNVLTDLIRTVINTAIQTESQQFSATVCPVLKAQLQAANLHGPIVIQRSPRLFFDV